jgi:ketosteroid isomerase-like protein
VADGVQAVLGKEEEMAHPNEELFRKGYEAFQRGDLDTIRDLFADDIVWHVGGRSQLAGDYRGKDEVLGWLGKNVELTGGTFRVDVHDILANDEHGVAITTVSAEREGKKLEDARGVQVIHIRDGKVSESWLLAEDSYTNDEFWG